MAGLLALLAIGFVLAWAGSIAFTAWMLTHPPRRTFASALARGKPSNPGELPTPLEFSAWTLLTGVGAIEVWDAKGHDPLGPIVVMVHGWGDSRIGGLARLPTIARGASRVLLFDLPGHGESPGRCGLGTRREFDIVRLVIDEVLSSRDGVAPAAIVLYGWSMGAGVAIACARECASIAAVIAEAPYRLARTPARNVLRSARLPYRLNLAPSLWILNLLVRGELRDRVFDRRILASSLRNRAMLVVHGERDEICPIEDGRAIAEAAAGDLAVIAGGGHNTLWSESASLAQCERVLLAFLARLRAPEPSPTSS